MKNLLIKRPKNNDEGVEYIEMPLEELLTSEPTISSEIEKKQIENRQLYLYGEIEDENIYSLIQKIRYLDSLNDEPITLFINSFGGTVYSGLALVDCIQSCESPIIGVAEGCIMSMAVAVLAACDIRVGGKYVQFMVHNVSGMFGNMSFKDINVQQQHLKTITEQYCEILSRASNLTTQQWYTKLYDKDTYFTAEQALEYGLLNELNPLQ